MMDAHASNGSPGGILGLVPLLIMGVIYGIILKFIAKRLGKSEWLWLGLGIIPIVNGICGIWLFITAYNTIMDKLEILDKKTGGLEIFKNEAKLAPRQGWTCSCGNVNEESNANCPRCGIKKEYGYKK
jgi:hypothetical protein